MRRIGFLLLLVLTAVLALANEKGDALVKQIEAVKHPVWIDSKREDPVYMKRYMADIAASTKKKNALVLQLYKVDPNHPKTVTLMRERWRNFESGNVGDGNAYAKRIIADIDAVLKENPPAAIAEAGESAKVQAQIDSNWNWEGSLPAINSFIAKYPKSEDGPNLLLGATHSMKAESRPPLFRRFVEAFPNHKFAPMVRGALRQGEGIGKPFDLKFTDAITGKPFDIADKRGKVLVIDFWATWCGPCVEKMPEVKKILDTYASQGLEVVGISLDQPEKEGGLKALKAYVAKNKYPWAQYYQGKGWESEFSGSWGIMSIPNVFLIDRKGNLREVGVRDLEKSVKRLLAETP